ncbi:hypothetical protein ACFO0M_00065, partial [Micromonospora mangrovi]
MSNDVTTTDGGAPMTPPTNRRRALWVATGVAGLTGVVGLAALGGLAARDNKSDDAQRASENHVAAPQNVSDAGTTEDETGKDADEKGGTDADEQNRLDQYGRDGKGRDERGEHGRDKDRDRDDHGRVREVPCDDEKLIEAVDLANRDHGGTLKLAPHCTYELSFSDRKAGAALPTIRQEITIKGEDSTIKRDSEDAFRLFRVADGGDLTLKDVTLKGGNAAEFKYGQAPSTSTQGGQNLQAPQGGQGGAAAQGGPGGPGQRKDGEADGGALLVEHGGSAHLEKVKLVDNNAEGNGGAIANYGRVDLAWSTVADNHARESGGGIFNAGLLKVKESHVAHNTAVKNGGGIANGHGRKYGYPHVVIDGRDQAGSVEIFKSTIEGNQAGDNGGGVFSSGGFVKIAFGAVVENTACRNGGGIYAEDTDLDLEKVIVAKNHADKDGGGIVNTGGEKKKDGPSYDGAGKEQEATATIADSRIVDNTAGRFGGGIFNGDLEVKLQDGFLQAPDGGDRKG